MTDFGKDTSCTDELRPGQIVTGVRLVAEAIYRRLTTPRGMLRGGDEEANYGLDLLELVGSVVSDSDVAALPGRVRNEILKDDRVNAVDVQASSVREGAGYSITLTITATTNEGPFTLQLAASAVSVELLGISTE